MTFSEPGLGRARRFVRSRYNIAPIAEGFEAPRLPGGGRKVFSQQMPLLFQSSLIDAHPSQSLILGTMSMSRAGAIGFIYRQEHCSRDSTHFLRPYGIETG